MKPELLIGLIGDQNPEVTAHRAIPLALQIAGDTLNCKVNYRWLPTSDLQSLIMKDGMNEYHGFWCVPASPYLDTTGALSAIKFARENNKPLLGSCGGFQHMAIEYAQNKLGFANADNAEINPDTDMPLIAPLSCALIEEEGHIKFSKNSTIAAIYQQPQCTEMYHCSFGLNSSYQHIFDESEIEICGFDENAEPRALEHKSHPFFVGVAFQPERSALNNNNHPLITAFINAVTKKAHKN